MWARSFMVVLLASVSSAHAGEARPVHQHAAVPNHAQTAWGIAGDAARAQRTVEVRMLDTMRFEPSRIEVRRGDTVRFVVVNAGKFEHEFVLGTRKELEHHAVEMASMGDLPMPHEESWMREVAPGKREELVWTFNRPGTFVFACLVPGHYQAGMAGTINVAR